MKRPRVLLADDHTLFIQALQKLLEPEFEVVGTVGDGRALLGLAVELKPDAVVIDIGMPLLNGLDAGKRLKEMRPDTKIIYLTQNRDGALAAEAFRSKASGYLLKNSAAWELVTALHEAVAGRCYISPFIAEGTLDSIFKQPHVKADLTPRQREVLQLLTEGHSMKEIATVLNVTTRTVEFHKYRIMEVLKVKTNAGLVQYAIKHGMISI